MSGEGPETVGEVLDRPGPGEVPGGRGALEISLGHPETLGFGSDCAAHDVWLVQSGDVLLGGDSYGAIGNGADGKGGVEAITTVNGSRADSQIGQLIQAMATYSGGHAGIDLAPSTMDDGALQATLVAAWHRAG